MPLSSYSALVPMICVAAAGIAAMTAEAFRSPNEQLPIGPLGAIGFVGAGISAVLLWGRHASSFGVVTADNFGLFVTIVLVAVGLLSLAFSSPTIDRERLPQGEYYALLLFATAGMMLMATASDLLVIFLALEVLSLGVYVLTGIRRSSPISAEAAMKYFLMGAFASAFFLYGIALTYGVTGSTHLDRIGRAVATQPATPFEIGGLAFLLIGFAFKVSAVPFHMWTPDAYEGAPPAVAGFMSTGVKAAAFAAFARVFLAAFAPLHASWSEIVWVIAALTMVAGSVIGVTQTSVKRMLAYSSIAHGGYLLVALASAGTAGRGALLFYLATYAVTNLGAFGVVTLLEGPGGAHDRVRDYAGLWYTRPGLALLMTCFLLSLGGFPPFGGFIAKWYVFTSAIEAGNTWLAIIGVLTSVISVFFYLRVVVMMFMTPQSEAIDIPPVPAAAGLALVVSAVIVLYLGILPTQVLGWATSSVATLF